MLIWNTTTKESKESSEIPDGWTDQFPAWQEFEIWDEAKKKWIVSLELQKNKVISQCKARASEVIFIAYPVYKQINTLRDHSEQGIIIAASTGKSIQDVNAAIYPTIQKIKTVEYGRKARDEVDTMDLDALVSTAPVELRSATKAAYRKLITAMITNKMIAFVQNWCNDKISEINACETIKELNKIKFDDYPQI